MYIKPCQFRLDDNICAISEKECDNCGKKEPLTFRGVVFVDDVAYKPQDIRDMKQKIEALEAAQTELKDFVEWVAEYGEGCVVEMIEQAQELHEKLSKG